MSAISISEMEALIASCDCAFTLQQNPFTYSSIDLGKIADAILRNPNISILTFAQISVSGNFHQSTSKFEDFLNNLSFHRCGIQKNSEHFDV